MVTAVGRIFPDNAVGKHIHRERCQFHVQFPAEPFRVLHLKLRLKGAFHIVGTHIRPCRFRRVEQIRRIHATGESDRGFRIFLKNAERFMTVLLLSMSSSDFAYAHKKGRHTIPFGEPYTFVCIHCTIGCSYSLQATYYAADTITFPFKTVSGLAGTSVPMPASCPLLSLSILS